MSEKQKENTTMNDPAKEETADNQNISANSLDNIYNVHYEFTINEEYEQLSLFLFSIWNVERTTTYKTDKLRPNEPKIMYAFIRTLSGCGKIITKKNTYILTPNTLILLDVNDIVEYSSVETTWTYYWYNFTPITTLPFFEQDKIYTLQTTYEEEHINKEMFELMKTYCESTIQLTQSLFIELIYRWIYLYEMEKNQELSHYREILEIASYINNNIKQEFTIRKLAQKCLLSERQFRCLFTKFIGVSPKKYICRQKLKMAASLLKTSYLTVKTIAYELNYCSPYQLSKDFKNYFGMSPKQYREKNFGNKN